MPHEQLSNNLSNRVVCVFDNHQDAIAAKSALIQSGLERDQVKVMHGDADASSIDTSAKWFADTDEEVKKFERELRDGNSIVSVPVRDGTTREGVHDLLKSHEARHITHFGKWITEVMR